MLNAKTLAFCFYDLCKKENSEDLNNHIHDYISTDEKRKNDSFPTKYIRKVFENYILIKDFNSFSPKDKKLRINR